jgi:hypothetical protein
MNANDMINESQRAAANEKVRLQREFLQSLQWAVAQAEPARLLMLLRIGAGLFGESDADRNKGVGMLLALATVDPCYEPLLSAWRKLLAPGAHELIEKSATLLAPLGA